MFGIRRYGIGIRPRTIWCASSVASSHRVLPLRMINTQPTAPVNSAHTMHDRILAKFPRFLRPYAMRFATAPFLHVTAFLILHEISAIVPLIGIWYLIHHYGWNPPLDLPLWAIERGLKILDSSMTQFNYESYNIHDKVQFIMEGAYAFVIVKFMLPLRLMFSILFMPWFAKWFILPFSRIFRKKNPPVVPSAPVTKAIHKPRL